jgi:hypothetical protein
MPKGSNRRNKAGKGIEFENKVLAYYIYLMIFDSYHPYFTNLKFVKITAQTDFVSKTDDIRFIMNDKKGEVYKLYYQLKLKCSIKSGKFKKVINAALTDFKNSNFNTERDKLVLLTGQLSYRDRKSIPIFFDTIYGSSDYEDFEEKHYSSETSEDVKAIYNDIKKILVKEGIVNSNEIYNFLKVFYIVETDLDNDYSFTEGVLKFFLDKVVGENDGLNLIEKVRLKCPGYRSSATTIDRNLLANDILSHFDYEKWIVKPSFTPIRLSRGGIIEDSEIFITQLAFVGGWDRDGESKDMTLIEKLTGENKKYINQKVLSLIKDQMVFRDANQFSFKISLKWSFIKEYFLDLDEKALLELGFKIFRSFIVNTQEDTRIGTFDWVRFEYSKKLRRNYFDSIAMVSLRISSSFGGVFLSELKKKIDHKEFLYNYDLYDQMAFISPSIFMNLIDSFVTEDHIMKLSKSDRDSSILKLLNSLEAIAVHNSKHSSIAVMKIINIGNFHDGEYISKVMDVLISLFLPNSPKINLPFEDQISLISSLLSTEFEVLYEFLLTICFNSFSYSINFDYPIFLEEAYESTLKTNEELIDNRNKFKEAFLKGCLDQVEFLVKFIDEFDQQNNYEENEIVSFFESIECNKLDDEDKFLLWTALKKLVIKHIKYQKTEWSISSDSIVRIQAILNSLETDDVNKLASFWFNDDNYVLYELDDIKKSRSQLNDRRLEILELLWSEKNEVGLSSLIETTNNFNSIAEVMALSSIDFDQFVSSNLQWNSLVKWYWRGMYSTNGIHWLNKQNSLYSNEDYSKHLSLLTYSDDIYELVDGEDQKKIYWSNFISSGEGITNYKFIIENLLKYKNIKVAVILAGEYVKNVEVDMNLIVDILKELPRHVDEFRYDDFYVKGLFEYVFENKEITTELADVEVDLISKDLLSPGYYMHTKIVDLMLSIDANYYIKLIKESESSIVLSNWKRPPGTDKEGEFNIANYKAWMDSFYKEIPEDFKNLGEHCIGKTLKYIPDLWKNDVVLNDIEKNENLLKGLESSLYNYNISIGKEEDFVRDQKSRAQKINKIKYPILEEYPCIGEMLISVGSILTNKDMNEEI